jgi:hypothetical protein
MRKKKDYTIKRSIGRSFKFPVKVAVEESIVNAPLDDTKIKRKVKRIDKEILEEIETLDQNKTEREMKIFRFLFLFFFELY